VTDKKKGLVPKMTGSVLSTGSMVCHNPLAHTVIVDESSGVLTSDLLNQAIVSASRRFGKTNYIDTMMPSEVYRKYIAEIKFRKTLLGKALYEE
jgi:hypothetical protein